MRPEVITHIFEPAPRPQTGPLPPRAATGCDRIGRAAAVSGLTADLDLFPVTVFDLVDRFEFQFRGDEQTLVAGSRQRATLGNRAATGRQTAIQIPVLRIPRLSGHRFHGKLDTQSAGNWTLIPGQPGHLFQGKLDT